MADSHLLPWIKRLQHLLGVVLTVYLAWCVSQVSWWMLADKNTLPLTLPAQQNVASVESGAQRVRPLASYHLFGREGLAKVENKPVVQEAPKTRLRLSLKGVFTAEQGGESGAIVEEIGRSTDYYRLGDVLPGNATLEAVYDDRILLRRNGQLETLPFDEATGSKGSMVSVAPKSQPRQQQRIATPEQFLEEATEQLAQNPEAALKSVGLARSAEGGYVYQGNNPMLAGMNLKKGDIIRSVNGHTLGDVQKDRALMKSLYEQGSLEVEVVRDGASFYINYPLR
ncbi:MAG: type II secretion system protein N [Oleiphilaceae bacterium]|nr:type II secretion system protein N [Oleiphilaceae bacterium]